MQTAKYADLEQKYTAAQKRVSELELANSKHETTVKQMKSMHDHYKLLKENLRAANAKVGIRQAAWSRMEFASHSTHLSCSWFGLRSSKCR